MGLAGIGAGVGKFAEMAKGVTSVATAATLAKTAANGLGKGLLGALGGPWGAAAIVIGTGISFIARETNRANDELRSHAIMAENLVGEYDSLTTKLSGMTQGTDEYTQTAKKLSDVKSSIADSLPEVINGWNNESGSIEINREAMQALVEGGMDEEMAKLAVTLIAQGKVPNLSIAY